MAASASFVGVVEAASATPQAPPEKTPEEIKAEEQKAAMLAMAAAAANAAAAAANKRKKGGRGKKKKGSWDLLPPKDRQTRFWVEQFGRDAAAGNSEAAILQRVVDKKSEENRIAKGNWEKEVRKMLKFLYQMDRKVVETRTNGSQAVVDLRQKVAEKKAKYEKYWAEALSLDPYEELVVDHSIGRTLSFVVLAQIAQPWGQLTEKLDIASKELEDLTYFKDFGQYENESEIAELEAEREALIDDLNANHDFLEALMDKMKRRGLRRIARRADEAKHAAAQKLLWLLSPADQEEIKNHAWFKAERRAYRKDDATTREEVDQMEAETLRLLMELLKEEEERLTEEVGRLEEEVAAEFEKEIPGALLQRTVSNVSSNHEVWFPEDAAVRGDVALEAIDVDDEEKQRWVHFEEPPSPNVPQMASVGLPPIENNAPPIENNAPAFGGAESEGKRDPSPSKLTNEEKKTEEEKDPYRPSCALPYDVPERLARAAAEMQRVCRANTVSILNPGYVVQGKSIPIHGAAKRQTAETKGDIRAPSCASSSSTNEYGGIKKKWPVTAKMMNAILPLWDPRKKPPKDEAPRDFRLANGRKPWDPSII